MVRMNLKECAACKTSKPVESYGKNKRQPDGLNYYCKPCVNQRVRDYKARMRARRPLNPIWEGMIGRCTNRSNKSYPSYGGRGIMVCQRWLDSYDAFESDMGKRPTGSSIDRIDNDGNYEPGNCRWATPSEQSRNTRTNHLITFNGETHLVVEWAELLGISRITLAGRLRRMSVEKALLQPIRQQHQLTFRGEAKMLIEWAKIIGVPRGVLYSRIFVNQWSIERALSTPGRVGGDNTLSKA